jgi:siroheme synthase-like protein
VGTERSGYGRARSRATSGPGAFAFPVFLEVRGRRCLVVGGGVEARHKAEALAALEASVMVSDPDHDHTARLAGTPGVTLHWGTFHEDLLSGISLAIVACDDRHERRRIARLVGEAGVLVNAVDENDLCDWAAPAILRRGGLTLAVGTGGIAPALAVRLRDRFAESLGPEYGALLELLGEVRPRVMGSGRPFADRRRLWYELVDGPALEACRRERLDEARAAIADALERWASPP